VLSDVEEKEKRRVPEIMKFNAYHCALVLKGLGKGTTKEKAAHDRASSQFLLVSPRPFIFSGQMKDTKKRTPLLPSFFSINLLFIHSTTCNHVFHYIILII
jgi:hypothetical protein